MDGKYELNLRSDLKVLEKTNIFSNKHEFGLFFKINNLTLYFLVQIMLVVSSREFENPYFVSSIFITVV